MQGPPGHRGWMGATVALALGLVLTWGLLRFGAAETAVLYRLFLLLLVPALLALVSPPWSSRVEGRFLVVGLIGVFLLGQISIQPTLEALGYLHLAVGWMAMWLTLWLTADSDRQARFLVGVLILLGVLEAFYGLAQSVGGVDYIGDYFRGRGRIATGTFINRNHFAALLNMVLPLALGTLVASQTLKRSQRATRSESLAKTWVVLLGSSVMGVAILMSQSRGGSISLLMTLLFMAMLLALGRRRASRRGSSGAAAGVLIFLVVGMGAAFGLEALLERFGRLDENLSRPEVYQDTLRMIGDSWVLGVGPAMYRWRFPQYQTLDLDRLYDHAHNDYLETAAEWGVLLALLGWGFVFWRFYRSSILALSASRPWHQGLALGCAGALFSILTHSLVDFSLQIPAILMVFACVVGLSWSDAGEGIVPSLAPMPSLVLRVLLVLALLAAGWQTLNRSRALEAAQPQNGISGLERAVALDPDSAEPHYLLAMAYRDLPGAGDPQQAAIELDTAVRLNPYVARYWLEYSRTQELLAEVEQAEDLLRVAVALTPASGENRWRLANLLIRQGDIDGAVEEIATAVELEPRLAEPAVALLIRLGVDKARVEALLPDDRAALLRVLRTTLRPAGVREGLSDRGVGEGIVPSREPPRGSPTEAIAASIWSRMMANAEPLTVAEGRGYVDHLFRTGRATQARQAWLDLMRANECTDAAFEDGSNRVWNGDFELDLAGTPLGWSLGRSEAFDITRSVGEGVRNSAALEIEFQGTDNLNFAHASQQLLLSPEATFELTVSMRSESLSTDQGVFLEVLSRDPHARLASTEPVVGTTDWTSLGLEFTMPEGSGVAVIRLRRNPSQQIDNRIRGKVWLDSVRIEPVSP